MDEYATTITLLIDRSPCLGYKEPPPVTPSQDVLRRRRGRSRPSLSQLEVVVEAPRAEEISSLTPSSGDSAAGSFEAARWRSVVFEEGSLPGLGRSEVETLDVEANGGLAARRYSLSEYGSDGGEADDDKECQRQSAEDLSELQAEVQRESDTLARRKALQSQAHQTPQDRPESRKESSPSVVPPASSMNDGSACLEQTTTPFTAGSTDARASRRWSSSNRMISCRPRFTRNHSAEIPEAIRKRIVEAASAVERTLCGSGGLKEKSSFRFRQVARQMTL